MYKKEIELIKEIGEIASKCENSRYLLNNSINYEKLYCTILLGKLEELTKYKTLEGQIDIKFDYFKKHGIYKPAIEILKKYYDITCLKLKKLQLLNEEETIIPELPVSIEGLQFFVGELAKLSLAFEEITKYQVDITKSFFE
jgi:hypothetical protein